MGTVLYQLPFATGTIASIGSYALHAGNFKSVDASPNPVIEFAGAGTTKASLDFLVGAGTAVHPVASGSVISAWGLCDVVVVDHGNGVWSEYVHIAVSAKVGDHVTPDSSLGTVLAQQPAGWSPPATCGNLENGPPHLHLSFANGSNSSGSYVPLAGTVLCGHVVDPAGNLTDLGTVGGSAFAVPICASGGTSTPAKLSASWKWKATTVPPKPWNESATQVLSNGRVVLFDDGNAVNKSRTYAVCGINETWPPPPGPGLKGQAFDPSGATWSEIPQTTLIDEDDADQQLPNGRLLVVGKKFYNADGDANPAAAIYDSGTNTWQAIPAPNALPAYAGTARLADGRIVMLDARDDTGHTKATLEAFNPKTGTWSVMWSPPATIYWEDLAALPDGTVLVYGVDTTNNNSPTLVIFDPATGKAKPVSAGSHWWPDLQTTASGKVVAWSEDEISTTSDQELVRAAVFDPPTDTWSAERTLTVPWGATVLVLRDGTVIAAGGTLETGSCDDDSLKVIPQTTVTALDPATGETTKLPPMPQADSNPWLRELADGRLLYISYTGAWFFGP